MEKIFKDKSIGQIITEARIKKKWTVEKLSTESLVKIEYIHNIEKDIFKFIEHTYIKSILNSLSKYLEIDKNKLIDQLLVDPKEEQSNNNFIPSPKKIFFISFIILFILCIFFIIVKQYTKKNPTVNTLTHLDKTIKQTAKILKKKIEPTKSHIPKENIPPVSAKYVTQFIKIICNSDSSWLTIYRPNKPLFSKKLLFNDTINLSFLDSMQAIAGVKNVLSVIYNNNEYPVRKFFSIENNLFSNRYRYNNL